MPPIDRRVVLTGTAAAVATAALPAFPAGPELPAAPIIPALSPLATPCPTEQWVRATLIANIDKAAAELAAAVARGEREQLLTWWYGYGLHLHREELRLFDRFEGSWRDIYRLPMAPGAFTGSADELSNYREGECPPCRTAA